MSELSRLMAHLGGQQQDEIEMFEAKSQRGLK